MSELLKKINYILNLDKNDLFLSQEIQAELSKIPDPTRFVEYLKANMNGVDADYKSGYQKFLFLAQRYKAQNKNQILLGVDDKAKLLIDKCRNISNYIYNMRPVGMNFERLLAKMDFENISKSLSNKELNILKSVGDFQYCMLKFDEPSFKIKVEAVIKTERLNYYEKTIGLSYARHVERLGA